MSRPRIDLGLEPSSVTLNEPVAARIGQTLATARLASALSVSTVADRLLLSRNQVLALEAVDPDVFYNVKFHAAALRKYADLLGVRTEAIDDVLIEPSDEANAQGGRESILRPYLPLTITAAAVVTIGALILLAS